MVRKPVPPEPDRGLTMQTEQASMLPLAGALAIAGLALVVVGLGMLWLPLGVIALGLLTFAAAVFMARSEQTS